MNSISYLAFTAAFPVDMAKRIFEKKFGKPPKSTFVKDRMLWVGPEPSKSEKSEKSETVK